MVAILRSWTLTSSVPAARFADDEANVHAPDAGPKGGVEFDLQPLPVGLPKPLGGYRLGGDLHRVEEQRFRPFHGEFKRVDFDAMDLETGRGLTEYARTHPHGTGQGAVKAQDDLGRIHAHDLHA